MEMEHKIELYNGQLALMRISKTDRSNEYVDVSLKAICQSDFSWRLFAKYDNGSQEIQLDQNNRYGLFYGQISAEDSVCRRKGVPFVNLSLIIPQNWYETTELFRQYKGCEVILQPTNSLLIYCSGVFNITFMRLDNKEQ
jgi:hypothetical protein